jgi:nucleoid-associated protein YgaU
MPKYHTQKYSNDDDQYQEILDERDIEEIVQYSIKFFNQSIKTAPIRITRHTWRQGDKLYKLAGQFYGDFRLWWVIAIVNKISSEADLKYGQVIKIPLNPSAIVNRI